MQLIKDSVTNFELHMTDEIDSSVRRGLAKYMVNYEKVLLQFSKFFDQEELQKILDRKADIILLQSVQEAKANKTDLEECLHLIDNVHERLKHLSIVQVEIARSMIPQKTTSTYNKEEAINHKITRREFLLKQASVTSQWVVDNPLKIEDLHNNMLAEQSEYNSVIHAGGGDNQSDIYLDMMLPGNAPIAVKQFEKYHNILQDHIKQTDVP